MTSLYDLSITPLLNALKAEQNILSKAEEFALQKNLDINDLLDARLAPDMWPVSQQITISAIHATTFLSKLIGAETNVVERGPAPLPTLKKYLSETIATLERISPTSINGKEQDLIGAYFGPESTVQLKAIDYVQGYLIPNVLFHQATLYGILRSKGVPLSKTDFLSTFIRLP